MTIEGAIVDLQNLIDDDGIPFWAKPSLQKILETVEAEREKHIALQEKSPCSLCKWHLAEDDTVCWGCNAKPIEEGAEE